MTLSCHQGISDDGDEGGFILYLSTTSDESGSYARSAPPLDPPFIPPPLLFPFHSIPALLLASAATWRLGASLGLVLAGWRSEASTVAAAALVASLAGLLFAGVCTSFDLQPRPRYCRIRVLLFNRLMRLRVECLKASFTPNGFLAVILFTETEVITDTVVLLAFLVCEDWKPEDTQKLNIRNGWPTILWMIPLRSSGGIAPTSVELLGKQAWDSSMALSILSFATVSSFSGVILPLSLLTARIPNTIMGESNGSLNAEKELQSQYCALGRGLIESIADLSVSELAGSVAMVCLIGTWCL